jgi:site-specific recombinase XerD
MFATALQTGLRLTELTGLKLSDIHLDTPAHVACHGKGRKDRATPLTPDIASLVAAYLTERHTRPGTALFPNPSGGQLSSDAVQLRLRTHLRTAQSHCPTLASKTVTVHTLRHTAAMRMLESGIDAAVIALFLGHESIATTGIYLHADLTIKQRALDRTNQPDIPPGAFHPGDTLLEWLENL